MAKLVVHQDKINDINELISICPFGAMEENNGKLNITAGCRLCAKRSQRCCGICRR